MDIVDGATSPGRSTDMELLDSASGTADLSDSDKQVANIQQPSYTVDEAIESIGLGRFQYVVLAMAGLCWTADAMEMLLLSFIKLPLQCLWSISDVEAALITTSVGVGMLLGALSWGIIADSYGRRSAFLAAAWITFFFGLVSAVSVSYPMMLISRGIVGFGIGGVPVAFSLIMEFLPIKSRGTWGMGLSGFWSLGAIFEALIAMVVMPYLGFRWLIVISTVPLGLLLVLARWLPESPRWLVSRGQLPQAQAILARASLANSRPLPPGTLVAPALDPDESSPSSSKGKIAELVRPGVRSLSIKIWAVWFACGFIYYGAVMLQPDMLAAENAGRRCKYALARCNVLSTSATCNADHLCKWGTQGRCAPSGSTVHVSPCDSALTRADYVDALYSTIGELPGTLATLFLIDKIGRRPLMGDLFALSAIAFGLLIPCLGRAAETATFFVLRGASSGYFQGAYLFTNELYPSTVRATGMGMASSVARVGLILTPFVAQFLDNISFALAIGIYAGASVLSVLAVWLIPIETTRRPLLNTTDELIQLLAQKDVDSGDIPTFATDPNVKWWVRAFRWRARIDGRASQYQTVES